MGRFSDNVRAHCGRTIIEPARKALRREVEIRVGDVHDALGYKNRFPLVCAALGAAVFEDQYRVRRLSIKGPYKWREYLIFV